MITKQVAGTQTNPVDLHNFRNTPGILSGREWMLWLAAILLCVPLSIRGYIGTLTRYTSDDFCWAMLVSDHGFLGLQAHLYTESYGRWAASALLSLTSYAGSFTAPYLPMLAIILCTAAFAWCSYEISQKLVSSILIAEVIVLAVMTATPRVAMEPFYWQSALLTYIPPFIIGPIGVALALRFKSATIAAIAACVVCGFNEAISIMVLCGLIIAIPLVDRARRIYVCAAATGALLSTVLAAASPGNAIRRIDANPMPDLSLLVDSFHQTRELLWEIAISPAGILLFVMGMVLAPFLPISRRIRPLWTIAIGLLPALCATAASVYGIKTLMARTAIVPTFSIVATILILGLWVGSKIATRNAIICLICTALFVIAIGSKSLSLLPIMQKYERSWEAQHKILENSEPDEHVILKPYINPFIDAWHISADPNASINRCVAAYYGVASVQTASDPR